MQSFKLIGICTLAATLCACSNFLSETEVMRNVNYTDTGVHELDVFPILRATGYATISVQKGPSKSQKTIQAMRASKLEAYKELTEQVYGIYIKANDKVRNSVRTSDFMQSDVQGVVHGARVIRQYPVGDTYVTELELDTNIIYQMYQIRGAL